MPKKFFVKLTDKEIASMQLFFDQKELREKHKIDIIINIFLDMYVVYIYHYNRIIPLYEDNSLKKFTQYENALKEGIDKALKLIK